MIRKTSVIWGIVLILLASLVGSAAAQSGVEPNETPQPAPETEVPGAKFFTHPVVKVLSGYFDRNWQPEAEEPIGETGDADPSEEPDPLATPDPSAPTEAEEPLAPASGLGPVGEEIAALHEEGMGFGVLVKLYAMAEAAQQACDEQAAAAPADAAPEGDDAEPEVCTPVTAQELVEAFQSGTGMGQLFKEHGKPALLGVGHVKKAMKELEREQDEAEDGETEDGLTDDDQTTVDDDTNGKDKDKDKGQPNNKSNKQNNGNGNGNGNGKGKGNGNGNGNGKGKGKP